MIKYDKEVCFHFAMGTMIYSETIYSIKFHTERVCVFLLSCCMSSCRNWEWEIAPEGIKTNYNNYDHHAFPRRLFILSFLSFLSLFVFIFELNPTMTWPNYMVILHWSSFVLFTSYSSVMCERRGGQRRRSACMRWLDIFGDRPTTTTATATKTTPVTNGNDRARSFIKASSLCMRRRVMVVRSICISHFHRDVVIL